MVMLWTDKTDNKTYTILAFDDWTVDKPAGLIATMISDNKNRKEDSDFKYSLVLMDEQGNITSKGISKLEQLDSDLKGVVLILDS